MAMVDRDRLERFVRTKLRAAGRRYEQTRRAYRDGEETVLTVSDGTGRIPGSVPRNPDGQPRIVCRRYADRRAVDLDPSERPTCFEAGHPDCEGCVEDLHAGTIETW